MRELAVTLIVAGLVVGVSALVVLHILPTGLSPMRNAVSQYGISNYSIGYRVQTLAYGVAGIGAAIGLASLPGPTSVAVVLCAVFAIARLAISWFPMDVPGGERTEHGRRHGLLAMGAFVGAGLAAGAVAKLLTHDHTHPVLASASEGLALVMLADLLAMGVNRRTTGHYFGLIERGFYALMTGWLVLVAVLLTGSSG